MPWPRVTRRSRRRRGTPVEHQAYRRGGPHRRQGQRKLRPFGANPPRSNGLVRHASGRRPGGAGQRRVTGRLAEDQIPTPRNPGGAPWPPAGQGPRPAHGRAGWGGGVGQARLALPRRRLRGPHLERAMRRHRPPGVAHRAGPRPDLSPGGPRRGLGGQGRPGLRRGLAHGHGGGARTRPAPGGGPRPPRGRGGPGPGRDGHAACRSSPAHHVRDRLRRLGPGPTARHRPGAQRFCGRTLARRA